MFKRLFGSGGGGGSPKPAGGGGGGGGDGASKTSALSAVEKLKDVSQRRGDPPLPTTFCDSDSRKINP
jgi:hypothetical protein